jgi:hypothetical protein
MGPFFRYWWRVLVLAFRHSLDLTQTIIFVLILLFGVASAFIPRAAALVGAMNGWKAAALILGGIVLVRLLLAPFWLDQKREKELALLQSSGVDGGDVGVWLALDPLLLEQIAFLWCGKTPRGSVLNAENTVRLQYEKLVRAILGEKLFPDWTEGQQLTFCLERDLPRSSDSAGFDDLVNPKTPVRQTELKRYAEAMGERPAFLFPVPRPGRYPPKIEISSGSGTPYELLEMIGERRKSVVKIGVRNSGDAIASNCAVLIDKLAPKLVHERAYPIKLGIPEFTLRHDDPEKFIEIAEYWAHVGQIRFNEPLGATFSGPLTYFDAGIRYSIVAKIRAAECTRSALFDLWVDSSNQLRLHYAGDNE